MKVWLVTGASRGIGLRIARRALERGDAVVATAREPDRAAERLTGHGDRLLARRLDVTDESQARAAARAADARFGRVDVLVHNAARGLFGAVEETSPAEARRLFEVNVFGMLAVSRAVLPIMRRQRAGRVIVMSSMGGFASGPGFGAYAASKFAVEGLGEALRDELAPLGIAVTLVEPGVFDTDFATASSDRAADRIGDYRTPAWVDQADDDGPPPGNPDTAAAAVLAVADSPRPPLRLPLGTDAIQLMRTKLASVSADLDAVERAAPPTTGTNL